MLLLLRASLGMRISLGFWKRGLRLATIRDSDMRYIEHSFVFFYISTPALRVPLPRSRLCMTIGDYNSLDTKGWRVRWLSDAIASNVICGGMLL